MARIRTIKPEFWTSAQVLECSTNARLLFLGLWNFSDDKGRHPDSPKQCKAEVFPADDFTLADITGMLDELSTNGLIKRYTHEGKGFFYIPGWRHQRIDKPQPAKYPDPFDERSTNIPGAFPPYTIGNDTKGKDKNSCAPKRRTHEGFERFWSAYPKKANRKKALEAWKRHNLEPLADRLTADVEARKAKDRGWREGFVPLATTYINGQRWEDEIDETAANGTSRGALQFENTLDNLRRLAGEETSGACVDSPRGDVRGQVYDGVCERTE